MCSGPGPNRPERAAATRGDRDTITGRSSGSSSDTDVDSDTEAADSAAKSIAAAAIADIASTAATPCRAGEHEADAIAAAAGGDWSAAARCFRSAARSCLAGDNHAGHARNLLHSATAALVGTVDLPSSRDGQRAAAEFERYAHLPVCSIATDLLRGTDGVAGRSEVIARAAEAFDYDPDVQGLGTALRLLIDSSDCVGAWAWFDEDEWAAFDSDISARIERAYVAGATSVEFRRLGELYTADLVRAVQVNRASGFSRPLRRTVPGDTGHCEASAEPVSTRLSEAEWLSTVRPAVVALISASAGDEAYADFLERQIDELYAAAMEEELKICVTQLSGGTIGPGLREYFGDSNKRTLMKGRVRQHGTPECTSHGSGVPAPGRGWLLSQLFVTSWHPSAHSGDTAYETRWPGDLTLWTLRLRGFPASSAIGISLVQYSSELLQSPEGDFETREPEIVVQIKFDEADPEHGAVCFRIVQPRLVMAAPGGAEETAPREFSLDEAGIGKLRTCHSVGSVPGHGLVELAATVREIVLESGCTVDPESPDKYSAAPGTELWEQVDCLSPELYFDQSTASTKKSAGALEATNSVLMPAAIWRSIVAESSQGRAAGNHRQWRRPNADQRCAPGASQDGHGETVAEKPIFEFSAPGSRWTYGGVAGALDRQVQPKSLRYRPVVLVPTLEGALF